MWQQNVKRCLWRHSVKLLTLYTSVLRGSSEVITEWFPKVPIRLACLNVACLFVHGEWLQGKTHPPSCSLSPGKLKRVPAGEDFSVPVNSVFWCTVKRIPGEGCPASVASYPGGFRSLHKYEAIAGTRVSGEGLFLFVFMFVSCCYLRGFRGRHVSVVCFLYGPGIQCHSSWKSTTHK